VPMDRAARSADIGSVSIVLVMIDLPVSICVPLSDGGRMGIAPARNENEAQRRPVSPAGDYLSFWTLRSLCTDLTPSVFFAIATAWFTSACVLAVPVIQTMPFLSVSTLM